MNMHTHARMRCAAVAADRQAIVQSNKPLGRAALPAVLALLLGGCQDANWSLQKPLSGSKPAVSSGQAPVPAAAPASQPTAGSNAQPVASDGPADQLSQEIQQYINNLPMDDLQAKLARHEGRPVPQAAATSPAPTVGEPAPAPEMPTLQPTAAAMQPAVQPTTAAGEHIPLEPEIIVPGSEQGAAQHLSATVSPSASATASVAPQAPATAAPHVATAPSPAVAPQAPAPSHGTQIVDIEIAPAVLASLPGKAAASPAGPRTNQPAAVKPSVAEELKHLIDQLRREAADRPDSVGAALRVRLAEWSLAGETQSPADWPLQDAEKRRLAESVWQVLQSVSKMDASPQGASPEQFQKAIESLTDTLEQVQPLQIPKAALCRSVSSFGFYEALDEPWRFPAGRTSMVVLYCELAGFRSEPAPQKVGWYRTQLSQRLAILTSSGKELWNYEDQQVEDLCRRPRRDFFITKLLKIPADLPAGDYVLKVTIRDKLANRVTETNVPFAIALPGGSAS